MPVTELAHFLLKHPYRSSHPSILSALPTAKKVLERASGCKFHFFSVSPNGSEASEVYILGHWQSVAAHQAFLPSEENQELLKLVEGLLDVEWMFHLDDQKVFGTEGGDEAREVLDAMATNEDGMKLVRVSLADENDRGDEGCALGEKRADFEGRIVKWYGSERSTRRRWPMVLGHRVEKDEGRDEAVILLPNIDPDQQSDLFEGTEVQHLWRMPLGE